MNGLNELAKQFHEKAKSKDFWDKPRETGTLLMLMVSELSEALEADRKNKHTNKNTLVKLLYENDPTQFVPVFQSDVKDTFEDEIADVFIRLLDFIGQREIDIESHIDLKMRFNQTREHKHGKAY